MKKLIKFTIADIRNIVRDPMQTLTAAAPLIIIVVLRIFLSVAREQVIQFFDYDIISDYPMIISFFSLLIPMMVGLVIGFIILDERDESMINYYAVTPLTKRGYLVFRMTVPIVFTFLVSVVFYLALYDIYAINMLNLLIVSILLAL
jgi:fluoroquinolone transport system permease protein